MPAKRAYGMDQDFYPWSPIVTRPPLRWPEGARVALAVIVNLEHWDWEGPPATPVAVSPMGGPEGMGTGHQPQFPHIGGWGHHQYANRGGKFRMLVVRVDNACLDDTYTALHGRRTINEVNLLWREWFDGLYADGAVTGRLMVLHLHPWITGQPWRIRHLDEVLGHICARQGVWKATGRDIIDCFKAQSP